MTVGAVLLDGSEISLPASSDEVMTCGVNGCGESWEFEASCGCREDTGVVGSVDKD